MSVLNIVTAMLLVFCQLTFANSKSVTIATEVWENHTNRDGSGYYLELMKEIYEPKGIKVIIKYVPFARSIAMANSGNADIMLGTYKNDKIIATYGDTPLKIHRVDAAITMALSKSWLGINSLGEKKVGALNGYMLDDLISAPMIYSEKSNLKSLLRMLLAGRLDAVINNESDIKEEQRKLKTPVNYVIKKSILSNSSYAIFSKTKNGEYMLDLYNKRMKELHTNGKLSAIMKKSLGNLDSYPFDNTGL